MLPSTTPEAGQDLREWLYGSPGGRPGPVYVLQSSQEFTDWWPKFEMLQQTLRAAALEVWKDKAHLLREPGSKAYIKRFFVSVTEEEFCRGLLWLSEAEQRSKTLVFRRTIADLAGHVADTEARKYMDVRGGDVDDEGQKLLHEQLAMVPAHVPTMQYEPLSWLPGKGVDPSDPKHAAYLRRFLDDFCAAMVASIKAGAQKLAVQDDFEVREAAEHLRFALARADTFTSTSSTLVIEHGVRAYLQGTSGGDGKALVLFGRSGAGCGLVLAKCPCWL